MREKSAFGFQTGDQVRAVVTKGKKVGTYTGRVAIRATGSFNIQTPTVMVQGISHKYCTLLTRCDGFQYESRSAISNIFTQELALRAALLPAVYGGVSALELR